MSTLNRLLVALGWDSPAEKDSPWGEHPPVKLSERRSSPRYPVSPNEALMGWWVGERIHKVKAQFRDVSLGGALIVTIEMPPYKYVWISLTKSIATRWCPVRIVKVRETSVGLIEVGLAFKETRDSDLFNVLVQRGHSA